MIFLEEQLLTIKGNRGHRPWNENFFEEMVIGNACPKCDCFIPNGTNTGIFCSNCGSELDYYGGL